MVDKNIMLLKDFSIIWKKNHLWETHLNILISFFFLFEKLFFCEHHCTIKNSFIKFLCLFKLFFLQLCWKCLISSQFSAVWWSFVIFFILSYFWKTWKRNISLRYTCFWNCLQTNVFFAFKKLLYFLDRNE